MKIAIVLALLLAGCSAIPTPITGAGYDVMPPQGWIEYCARRTNDEACVARGVR
jgi:hypothetical protein